MIIIHLRPCHDQQEDAEGAFEESGVALDSFTASWHLASEQKSVGIIPSLTPPDRRRK
jgi:hypothetical protein